MSVCKIEISETEGGLSLVPTPFGVRDYGTAPPEGQGTEKAWYADGGWGPPSGVKPQELHKLQRLITPYNTRKTELVLLISRDLPKTAWISIKSLSFSKDLRKPPWRAGRRKTTTRGVCEGESPAQVVGGLLSLQSLSGSFAHALPQNAFDLPGMCGPARGFPADCAAVASKRGLPFRGAPPRRRPGSSPPDPLPPSAFSDAVKSNP